MSHIPNAPASEVEKQEHIQNALFNVGYNAEFSRRGAIKAALALTASAVLFGLPGRAYAARASQKTLDALATAEEKLAAVEAELEQLAAEFQALSLEQEKTIAQIDDVQTQIDETQEQIEEKQQELEDKQNVLAGRVSDSYKDGPGSTLKLLLAAKSFDELLSNSRYVEKINDADKQVISEIQQIRESLEQQKQNWSSRRPSWRPSGSSRPTSSPTCRPSKAKSKLWSMAFPATSKSSWPSAMPNTSPRSRRSVANRRLSSSTSRAAGERRICPATPGLRLVPLAGARGFLLLRRAEPRRRILRHVGLARVRCGGLLLPGRQR